MIIRTCNVLLAAALLSVGCATAQTKSDKAGCSGCPDKASSPAGGAATERGPDAKGPRILSKLDVEKALAAGAVMVDARSAGQFADGHLPGAVHVTMGDLATFDRLPRDKATMLVTYCSGPS